MSAFCRREKKIIVQIKAMTIHHQFDKRLITSCIKSGIVTSSCFSLADYLCTVRLNIKWTCTALYMLRWRRKENNTHTKSIHLFLKSSASRKIRVLFHCFAHMDIKQETVTWTKEKKKHFRQTHSCLPYFHHSSDIFFQLNCLIHSIEWPKRNDIINLMTIVFRFRSHSFKFTLSNAWATNSDWCVKFDLYIFDVECSFNDRNNRTFLQLMSEIQRKLTFNRTVWPNENNQLLMRLEKWN